MCFVGIVSTNWTYRAAQNQLAASGRGLVLYFLHIVKVVLSGASARMNILWCWVGECNHTRHMYTTTLKRCNHWPCIHVLHCTYVPHGMNSNGWKERHRWCKRKRREQMEGCWWDEQKHDKQTQGRKAERNIAAMLTAFWEQGWWWWKRQTDCG